MATRSLIGGLVLAGALSVPPAAVASGSSDSPFRPFELKSVEGSSVALNEVMGRATLVVFFFPTCTFCNIALPQMQQLHDRYKEQGLSVILINVVPEQEPLIAEWRQRHGYSMPVLLGGRSIQKDYRLKVTPTHYLLNGAGLVVARHAGFKRGDETKLERKIRDVLGLRP